MNEDSTTTVSSPPGRPYHIHVYIDPNLAYFREAILGIRQYGFQTGRLRVADRWQFPERMKNLPEIIRRDKVDGIIAAIHHEELEEEFSELEIPVVNVSNTLMTPRTTVVTQDDFAVGQIAGEHLKSAGGQQFAFWGHQGARYSQERLEGFREAVAKCGGVIDEQSIIPHFGKNEYRRIHRWLSGKQPPLAVFSVIDHFAVMILRAARELGWRIPEEVAVIGAGDDEFLIAFENVPLSSVKLPSRRIGYEAGLEMDRLITTGQKIGRGVRLPPLGLTARQSTDTIFTNDEAIVKALRYIRSHATQKPYIKDIAKAAGVARTTLQKKFQQRLGRTMLDEIQTVRVSYAKDLLRNSNLNLGLIAERCGFSNAQRFSVVFRKVVGKPPGAYRSLGT